LENSFFLQIRVISMAVEVNSEIMRGKPVIRGTRVTLELILRKLSEEMTPEQIVEAHPSITVSDVYDSLAYAAYFLEHKKLRIDP
jgi:uncharacterized protein (DUF433 family)